MIGLSNVSNEEPQSGGTRSCRTRQTRPCCVNPHGHARSRSGNHHYRAASAKHQVTENAATSPSAPATADAVVWHVATPEQVLERLGASKDGLPSAEAARRLAEHGPNELQETNVISPLAIFLGQFKSLIVWILIIAGVVSGLLGEDRGRHRHSRHRACSTAVIGFYQEFKAEKSIAALSKMTAPQARIRRDGKSSPYRPPKWSSETSLRSKPATLWPPTRVCWRRLP